MEGRKPDSRGFIYEVDRFFWFPPGLVSREREERGNECRSKGTMKGRTAAREARGRIQKFRNSEFGYPPASLPCHILPFAPFLLRPFLLSILRPPHSLEGGEGMEDGGV